MPRIFWTRPTLVKSKPDLGARTDGQEKVTSPPPNGGWPRFVICPKEVKQSATTPRNHLSAKLLTLSSTPSVSKNIARCGHPLVLTVSTLASLPSVVTPLSVNTNSFFPNGASASSGSRNQPTDRSSEHWWVKVPPAIVPGWNRSEVPV